ncbi:MAG: vitamin B12 dependent-methionine synthase activation domain-containing protein, partial [Bacillota bacterium]
LQAAREHQADAIGMSGLLVKSVAVMKDNLGELNAQGITLPVLLGGAALTRDYAEETLANLYKGAVLYCKDAFDGLRVMDAIANRHLDRVVTAQRDRAEKRRRLRESAVRPQSRDAVEVPQIAKDNPVPQPPFWGRRVVTDLSPRHIFPFINENALFRGQWGYKQGKLSEEEFARSIEEKARPVFAELQRRAVEEGFLQPKVVYGYFPVQAHGNDLIVYHVEEFQQCTCHTGSPACLQPKATPREWLRFTFPRQDGRRRLCISDFFRSVESGQYDVLGVQLVTVGDQATALAEKLRTDNKYQEYLYLHGFGVESAEALAEFWHKRMRQELGFSSDDAPTVRELFQQGYRGSRYSFGYPACPNLEDRALIIELLKPQDLGVTLSENYMLIPEQSTDALVVHHPQAKYFDI